MKARGFVRNFRGTKFQRQNGLEDDVLKCSPFSRLDLVLVFPSLSGPPQLSAEASFHTGGSCTLDPSKVNEYGSMPDRTAEMQGLDGPRGMAMGSQNIFNICSPACWDMTLATMVQLYKR